MNASDGSQLILDVLSGDACDARRRQLGSELGESAELIEQFLDHVDVEVFLASEAKAGAYAEDREALFSQLEDENGAEAASKVVPLTRRLWFRAMATTTAAAACAMLFFGVFAPRPLSAASALQKLIDASREAGDRTYTVSIVRGSGELHHPRGSNPTLEDSTIHLRGAEQYVAIQDLVDGSGKQITGFDGTQSWTIPGDGPVQVSDDPNRFRRFLPGARFDLPFINLHDQLEELRDGYDIELKEDESSGNLRLRATRKLREAGETKGPRSPRELLITFEPESGIIVSLEFKRPTKQRGRPVIRLELVEQRELPADFFSHTAHHEPGRPVREGPPGRRPR